MEDNDINLNNKITFIDDKILVEIVDKLENIIKDINDNDNLVNKIKDINKNLNNFINEYKKNSNDIIKYIENLKKELTEQKQINESSNNNKNNKIININSEVKEKIFQSKTNNKGKYIGQLINGKREGRGIIKWDNGDIYNGE